MSRDPLDRQHAGARIRAIESIVIAAMSAGDCITAPHAFRVARSEARVLAAYTNDGAVLAALRNIESVCSMGLRP